jgi:hypothetical protein
MFMRGMTVRILPGEDKTRGTVAHGFWQLLNVVLFGTNGEVDTGQADPTMVSTTSYPVNPTVIQDIDARCTVVVVPVEKQPLGRPALPWEMCQETPVCSFYKTLQ